MAVCLQPETTSIGRSLDVVPRDPRPAGSGPCTVSYTVFEGRKLAVGIIVAVWIARGGHR